MYFVIRYPYAYDTEVVGIEEIYLNVPSLRLDINPNEMTIDYEKNINRTLTSGGWFEEYWNDKLTLIQARGSTGAFIHKDFGLCTINRNLTRQYQVFLALIRFYQDTQGMT